MGARTGQATRQKGKRHWDGPREVAGGLGRGAVVLQPRRNEAPAMPARS
jgi:hypothetical protein